MLRASIAGRQDALAIVVNRASRRHNVIHSRALHLNATGDPDIDCITIEHNGFAAPARFQPALTRSLLDWFAREQRVADEMYLGGVTWPPLEVSGRITPAEPLLRKSYLVDLSLLRETGGDLAPILSRNARQQLRRILRSHERVGPLRLEEADTIETALQFFEGLKDLHIKSWMRRQKTHSFSKPFFETFHRSLITACFPQGEIQLLRISSGDWIIGYLYNFRHKNRIYAYQSGFDDSDNHWRPGYVSHYLAINHNFRSGMRSYDLLAGDNRLKRSFATTVYDMYWHRISRAFLRFRIENKLHEFKHRWLEFGAPAG